MVITEIKPKRSSKRYPIIGVREVFLCFPPTKEEELELMLCYNGNNIQGNLWLSKCRILNDPLLLKPGCSNILPLPDNLTVNGWLNLWGTPIKTLPKNLKVKEWLYLNFSGITELPDDLETDILHFPKWKGKIPKGVKEFRG